MRVAAAVAVLLAGWEHFSLWRSFFDSIPTIGPLFVADAIFSLFLAAALLVSADLVVTVIVFLFEVGALGAFAISYYGTLFGWHSTLITSQTTIVLVAEAIAAALALVLTVRSLLPLPAPPQVRLG